MGDESLNRFQGDKQLCLRKALQFGIKESHINYIKHTLTRLQAHDFSYQISQS